MAKIDCQVIREEILQHVRSELEKIDYETELAPSLAIITIGDDAASEVYVNNKRKACESLDCSEALRELERRGVDGIITFDVHNPAIENALQNML